MVHALCKMLKEVNNKPHDGYFANLHNMAKKLGKLYRTASKLNIVSGDKYNYIKNGKACGWNYDWHLIGFGDMNNLYLMVSIRKKKNVFTYILC